MTMEKFFQKDRLITICDDWTKFTEAEFQKESWDGIKRDIVYFQ